ncbi:hypothetical protein [Kitasatospora sp. NBC_01300]|uniref:hypothetical protein n=1 Tax=Kitasatospora sp. NBC_01300 TaxID=2903574 RepID=UPI002F919DA3|nr:hypothetical protein OG556_40230 [Kitasatospora sp. NBC_01300]
MTTTNPPTTEPGPAAGTARRTLRMAARERWARVTAPGMFLDRRRQDVRDALDHGWRAGARWVRLVTRLLIVLGVTGAAVVLYSAAAQVLAASGAGACLSAMAGTVTGPVRHYLAEHTAGLPLSAADAYRLWAATGLTAALLSCVLRSTVARIAWTSWSAGTLAAVWQASPDGGRTVATAVTAAVLAAVSLPALRGLAFFLRPHITIHRTVLVAALVTVAVRPGPVVPAPRRPLDQP